MQIHNYVDGQDQVTFGQFTIRVAVQCCSMLATRLGIQPILLGPQWPPHAVPEAYQAPPQTGEQEHFMYLVT